MIPELGVTERSLLVLFAGAIVLAHALLFAFIYVQTTGSNRVDPTADTEAGGDEHTTAVAPTGGHTAGDSDSSTTCPHCGVDNEPGYRFCRHCTEELNGGIATMSTSTGQQQRPF